jgi:non-specific serine/threonine protein kinase
MGHLAGKAHVQIGDRELGLSMLRAFAATGGPLTAKTENVLGDCALVDGELEEAEAHYLVALERFRAHWSPDVATFALNRLGYVALLRGDRTKARARLAEALPAAARLRALTAMAGAVDLAAAIALDEGDVARAGQLLGASEALQATTGVAPEPALGYLREPTAAAVRSQLGDTRAAGAAATGRGLSRPMAMALALTERKAADCPPLTARELQVARLVAVGSTNRQIAGALFIGERTAESHVARILRKLDLRTRTQLAVWMERNPPAD